MQITCGTDAYRILAEQRVDVGQVLQDRHFIALSFVALVPLIVVVKNHRDDVVEIIDKTVGNGSIDQPMQPVVEV